MDKREIRAIVIIILLFNCTLMLGQCGGNNFPGSTARAQEALEEDGSSKTSGFYDSSDTAIIVEKQEDTITLFNLLKGRRYTLNVTGGTRLYDKYGSAISFSQLSVGEIVDIQFLKGNRQLTNLQISDDVWTMDEVERFEVDYSGERIKIMNEWYKITDNTAILSGNEEVELIDVNAQDVLRVHGVGHDIYSIVIQKGHGYLRLTNDEYFIGGWIEVGQKIIRQIEPDMLLAVPEGTYQVFLSHSDIEGVKEVVISRGEEVELDVGDIRKDDLVKYGNLIFTVEPSSAAVYLDGKLIDISRTIKAEYGLHQIMVKADGYETVIQYIKVSQGSANVSIALDKEQDRSVSGNTATAQNTTGTNTPTVSSNTVSSNSTKTTSGNSTKTTSGNSTTGSSTGYKVNINSPIGAEVYVDGNYVGMAPVSFAKKVGSRVVTIRKNGYQTRTYTIEIDKEGKDVNYSFSELLPISDNTGTNTGDENSDKNGSGDKNSNTVSENTISGNTISGNTISGNTIGSSTISGNTTGGNSTTDNRSGVNQ